MIHLEPIVKELENLLDECQSKEEAVAEKAKETLRAFAARLDAVQSAIAQHVATPQA